MSCSFFLGLFVSLVKHVPIEIFYRIFFSVFEGTQFVVYIAVDLKQIHEDRHVLGLEECPLSLRQFCFGFAVKLTLVTSP